MADTTTTYRQIFRSSSLMAGAQVIQYGVGLVRTKVVALLLGPAGVGIVAVYMAVTSVVSTAAGLGLGSSGVRAIADARGASDDVAVALTVQTVRRMTAVTGAAGALVLVLFSGLFSRWSFGHDGHTTAMVGLAAVVLLAALDNGEAAVMQGLQRVDDLAWRTIAQAVLATGVTVAGYLWLGEEGIVPVLGVAALASYLVSFWLGHRARPPARPLPFRVMFAHAGPLVKLGLAFMWAAVISTATAFVIRSMIVRTYDNTAGGLYQAAWSLSGMFASLVLTAMASDFYPRLAASARDPGRVNELVNQQTEIGILLALPGLVGTLMLAPWAIELLYSPEFAPATYLMPGFVLGVLGRVVSWPMSYILVARSESRIFIALETTVGALHVALAAGLMHALDLAGVAWAFATLYVVYTAMLVGVAYRLTGFRWSSGALRVGASGLALTGVSVTAFYLLDRTASLFAGITLTVATTAFVLRSLASRLGDEHRLVRSLVGLPGGRWLLSQRAPSSDVQP